MCTLSVSTGKPRKSHAVIQLSRPVRGPGPHIQLASGSLQIFVQHDPTS